ncbi:MAG: cupin [Acidimicrobiales bacterium]
MTLLTVWPDDQPGHVLLRTEDTGTITAELKRHGVGFARWPLAGLAPDAGEAEMLAGYRDHLDGLTAAVGYHSVDVMRGDTPPAVAERSSGADEDRFFVSGSAVWYVHAGRWVHAILCEPGDLLRVPAHTRHWHDGGERPGHVTIRVRHPSPATTAPPTAPLRPADFPGFDALVADRATGWPVLTR